MLDNKINFEYRDIILSLSRAIELTDPRMLNHLKKVAFISYSLAKIMGVDNKTHLMEIFTAGLLHDIGILYLSEKDISRIFEEEEYNGEDRHAEMGASILRKHTYLGNISGLIENHHSLPGTSCGYKYADSACIIAMADRIANKIDGHLKIVDIKNSLKAEISSIFYGSVYLNALDKLLDSDSFWIVLECDLVDKLVKNCISELSGPNIKYDDIKAFLFLIARLIDFRSPFTYSHSFNVASVARYLAEEYFFSEYECEMMFIAGLLHDIGKLAVPVSYLDKRGPLTFSERKSINTHTFYTYDILSEITNIHPIEEWAAYHHEKLDGSGYPFHLTGKELSTGSRIMCVADIFAALLEDRPYKKVFEKDMVVKVLRGMAENNKIDSDIVETVIHKYHHIEESLLLSVKEKAEYEYRYFLDMAGII